MTPPSGERLLMHIPDAIQQGEYDVKVIENDATSSGKVPADEVRDTVKRDIDSRDGQAKAMRTLDNKRGGVQLTGDDTEALNVATTVSSFMEAVRKGYILRPTHGPTGALYDSLISKLRGNIDMRSSVYLQPLIRGVLNKPNYVDLTPGSDFLNDLEKIIPGFVNDEVDNLVNDILLSAALPTADKLIIRDKFKEIKAAKEKLHEKKVKEAERRSGFSDAERRYIENMLERDKAAGLPEAEEIDILLKEAFETPQAFHDYYTKKYQAKVRPGVSVIEAKKEATAEIHQLFMYLTHRIFAPVIEHAGTQNWQDLIHHSSQAFGINPDSVFNHVSQRFTNLLSGVLYYSPLDKTESEEGENGGFYQLGMDKLVKLETSRDDKGEIIKTEQREIKVISSEIQKVESFKEFLERFSISLGAERDLLEVGINFNFLLNTGKTSGSDVSFFKQAAAYAKDQLKNHRIDELYRLPYGEIVHAARIELASQYKRELAFNRWQKRPDIFSSLFQHTNTAEHHVLTEMIHSHLGSKAPEWAIRRALLHARMHMSLISVDLHAISSYGHPYLTDDMEATYTDTTLARLETYRTWWDAEKWRTNELFRYGLAFMPRANRQWMHEVWLPEDVWKEGETIYKDSDKIGKLALKGRTYFTSDTPPNIFELNEMEVAGTDRNAGWESKYPYTPWIDGFIDYPTSKENFKMNHKDKEGKQDFRDMEFAWKQIENLGIESLRNFKDTYLFGNDVLGNGGKFLQLEGGKVKYEKQYEHFFKFLYKRYFAQGVGREALGFSFRNYNKPGLPQESYKYSDTTQIKDENDFWEKIVEPILNRRTIRGQDGFESESQTDADKRNLKERSIELKKIIDQALGVMFFERLPIDMVVTEDPLISQNGKTFLQELQQYFVEGADEDGNPINNHHHKMKLDNFKHAFHDLEYVQGMARTISVEKMKEKIREQNSNGIHIPEDQTTFGSSKADLGRTFSTITLTDEQKARGQSGYIIDENLVKDLLTQKYARIWDSKQDTNFQFNPRDTHNSEAEQRHHAIDHHVSHALAIYKEIRRRVVEKPEVSYHEKHYEKLVDGAWVLRELKFDKKSGILYKPDQTQAIMDKKRAEIIARLKKEFADARKEGGSIKTRLAWSGEHLLDPKNPITINDAAYPFLYYASTGEELVSRRLTRIAETQEQYKAYIMGEYDSHLKKYYRNEDKGELLKAIIGVRSRIKDWLGPGHYNGTALFILENSINVMRIRSDGENMFAEMDLRMLHEKRSAMSGVATEGNEYPLRREERHRILTEFMHSGQFPKRASEKVYELETKSSVRRRNLKEKLQIIPSGEQIANMVANFADLFLGTEERTIVRNRWKELSGEAMRDRQFASIMQLFTKEVPKFLVIAMLALAFLVVVKGYQDAEKASA